MLIDFYICFSLEHINGVLRCNSAVLIALVPDIYPWLTLPLINSRDWLRHTLFPLLLSSKKTS